MAMPGRKRRLNPHRRKGKGLMAKRDMILDARWAMRRLKEEQEKEIEWDREKDLGVKEEMGQEDVKSEYKASDRKEMRKLAKRTTFRKIKEAFKKWMTEWTKQRTSQDGGSNWRVIDEMYKKGI